MPETTLQDIRNLKAAIDEAETWRGSLDPKDYEEFDAWIKETREGLKRVTADRMKFRRLASGT